MKYTIDRFEEEFAILEGEDRSVLQVEKSQLPPDVTEGCILTLTDNVWQKASDEDTAQRIRSKMDALWN